MQISRLFEIVYLLLERGSMTAGQLAEHFEVSIRTIYRDVDALSEAGIPLYTSRGKGGGISLISGFVLSKSTVTPREQEQILSALRGINTAGGGSDTLLSKLGGIFQSTGQSWIEVDFSDWSHSNENNKKFTLLRDAILQRKQVSFRYYSPAGISNRRALLPVRLCFRFRAWYLQGYCLDRQDYRTFKLSRMLEVDAGDVFTRELAAPPPIPVLWGGNPKTESMLHFVIRFHSQSAFRVIEEFDESLFEEEPGGSLLLRINLPDEEWVYNRLLSFGRDAQVLEPQSARQRLAEIGRQLTEHYSSF